MIESQFICLSPNCTLPRLIGDWNQLLHHETQGHATLFSQRFIKQYNQLSQKMNRHIQADLMDQIQIELRIFQEALIEKVASFCQEYYKVLQKNVNNTYFMTQLDECYQFQRISAQSLDELVLQYQNERPTSLNNYQVIDFLNMSKQDFQVIEGQLELTIKKILNGTGRNQINQTRTLGYKQNPTIKTCRKKSEDILYELMFFDYNSKEQQQSKNLKDSQIQEVCRPIDTRGLGNSEQQGSSGQGNGQQISDLNSFLTNQIIKPCAIDQGIFGNQCYREASPKPRILERCEQVHKPTQSSPRALWRNFLKENPFDLSSISFQDNVHEASILFPPSQTCKQSPKNELEIQYQPTKILQKLPICNSECQPQLYISQEPASAIEIIELDSQNQQTKRIYNPFEFANPEPTEKITSLKGYKEKVLVNVQQTGQNQSIGKQAQFDCHPTLSKPCYSLTNFNLERQKNQQLEGKIIGFTETQRLPEIKNIKPEVLQSQPQCPTQSNLEYELEISIGYEKQNLLQSSEIEESDINFVMPCLSGDYNIQKDNLYWVNDDSDLQLVFVNVLLDEDLNSFSFDIQINAADPDVEPQWILGVIPTSSIEDYSCTLKYAYYLDQDFGIIFSYRDLFHGQKKIKSSQKGDINTLVIHCNYNSDSNKIQFKATRYFNVIQISMQVPDKVKV